MKPHQIAAAGLFALILSPASSSLAQTPPDAPAGAMTMGPPRAADEVAAWADRLFDRLDADADGVVTGGELMVLARGPMAAHGGSRIRAMVAQSDASNDARVSREELQAGASRMFSRMDADGDGRLSDDELPRLAPSRAAPVLPMPAADPMPMPDMGSDD